MASPTLLPVAAAAGPAAAVDKAQATLHLPGTAPAAAAQPEPGILDSRLRPLEVSWETTLPQMTQFLYELAGALTEHGAGLETARASAELHFLVGRLVPTDLTPRVRFLLTGLIEQINGALVTASRDMGEEGLRALSRVAGREASTAINDLDVLEA